MQGISHVDTASSPSICQSTSHYVYTEKFDQQHISKLWTYMHIKLINLNRFPWHDNNQIIQISHHFTSSLEHHTTLATSKRNSFNRCTCRRLIISSNLTYGSQHNRAMLSTLILYHNTPSFARIVQGTTSFFLECKTISKELALFWINTSISIPL